MSEKTKRKKRKNFSKSSKSVKVITNNSEFQSSFSKMSKIVLMISILLQGSGKKDSATPFYSFTPYLKPLTYVQIMNQFVKVLCAGKLSKLIYKDFVSFFGQCVKLLMKHFVHTAKD
jgi:hypothetical protein